MSGQDAIKELLAVAAREDVVSSDLVARALTVPKWKLLRDWRRRKHPVTKVGRDILFSADLTMRTYFPHHPQNLPNA